MVLRQHENGVRRFRDGRGAGQDVAHHRPAHKIHGIFDLGAARQAHGVFHRSPDGHAQRDGVIDFRHDADEFVDDRLLFIERARKVVTRFHVENAHAALDGQSAWAHHPARHFVYQHDLVAGGVHFI